MFFYLKFKWIAKYSWATDKMMLSGWVGDFLYKMFLEKQDCVSTALSILTNFFLFLKLKTHCRNMTISHTIKRVQTNVPVDQGNYFEENVSFLFISVLVNTTSGPYL